MKKILVEKLIVFRIPEDAKRRAYLPLLMVSTVPEPVKGYETKMERMLLPIFRKQGHRLPDDMNVIYYGLKGFMQTLEEESELYYTGVFNHPENSEMLIRKYPKDHRITAEKVEDLCGNLFGEAMNECDDLDDHIRMNMRLYLFDVVNRYGMKSAPIFIDSDYITDYYNQMFIKDEGFHFKEELDRFGRTPYDEMFMMSDGKGGRKRGIPYKCEEFYVLDITQDFHNDKLYAVTGRPKVVTKHPYRAMKFANTDDAVKYALHHLTADETFSVSKMDGPGMVYYTQNTFDEPFWT